MKKQLVILNVCLAAFAFFGMLVLNSCSDDDDAVPDKEVEAIFSSSASGNTVSFVNASANATTFAWTFGDGGTSTEKDPVHEYDEPGKYTVTLTASNASFEDVYTLDVLTENAGLIAKVLVGKTWIPIRQQSLAIAMGPQTDDWTYKTAPWFGWGDLDGATTALLTRQSLMNDEYVFNQDGTYTVDFNGDFWGEFGIWEGNEAADQVDIPLTGATLPLNKNNEDVSAFVAGTWDWEVDETAKTLTVKGAGAHILNPRYKNNQSTLSAGTGITYTVVKAVEGPEADTLVVYVELHDNEFSSDPREYHILASYHGTVPEPKPIVVHEPQFDASVSSATVSHTFTSATGAGTGVAFADGPYDVDYAANIGGKACTKLTKDNTEQDRYANYLFFAGTAGDPAVRKEIDFTGGQTKVSLEVYIPSSNVFSVGGFQNLVRIRFIDQSQYASFWEHYIQLEQANIATDQWVTLTFDFTAALAAGAAETSPNKPDGVMIEFGEVNHIAGGTIYVRDFKIVNP